MIAGSPQLRYQRRNRTAHASLRCALGRSCFRWYRLFDTLAKMQASPVFLDKMTTCRYQKLNSASHASASACAPGGTFFAQIPRKFKPLAGPF